MKKMVKSILLIMFTSSISLCQISLDGIGNYNEDFNTLAISGTSSVVPTGWAFSESGTNANTTYNSGTGSSNVGDTYSFGAASSTERAFGGLRSGSLIPIIGASFFNNTGFTITQLPITYTGEQWRAGVTSRNAADRIDFQLSTDATSLTTGTWTNYDALDFQSPNINTTAGALDGNAAGNRTTISYIITGLSITNGTSFWIRWTDFDITSTDDGLAIDDFSIDETSLPVELSFFSAVILDNGVKLNWQTETEVNNYGFEVGRLQNYPASGKRLQDWETIGFVEGNGNSNSPKDYSFVDNKVAAGKYSYRLKQIDTDGQFEYSKIINVDLGLPSKFELSQNYPNPFNPSTTISFTLPESGNIKLIVYNIIGQRITELVNGFQEAGIHTINFNGENLPSGFYFYRLETKNNVENRKMLLIK